MKFLIILSLLYLVLSQAPKGRFINISVNNTHAIGKVDGLNSTSTFYFSVPKPRRECSNSVPCYVVEIVTFDSKRNKVYFLLSTTVSNLYQGQEIHFYELDYKKDTNELIFVKRYPVLSEYARYHTTDHNFVEGLTLNEETNEVYIHLYRSKLFILNPENRETRVLPTKPYSQPHISTTIFSQKDQTWFIFDIQRDLFVDKISRRARFTRKLESTYRLCPLHTTHLIRDEESKALYLYCGQDQLFKRIIIDENNIEDSLIQDPRMEIGTKRYHLMFSENGILYFVDQFGNISGFNSSQTQPVYQGRFRYNFIGKTIYVQ